MTTVSRPYINPSFEQETDDGCLEYKSIPMAVVNNVIKVQHEKNDFTGIKQIYNKVPPRPMNINVMANSIARINNLPYQTAVPMISKQFINEEVADVNRFVNTASFAQGNNMMPPAFTEQVYVPEQAVRSSTGVPLSPSTNNIFRDYPENLKKNDVSLILGNVNPTSGVVPFGTSISSQTDWVMNKQNLSQKYQDNPLLYGIIKSPDYDPNIPYKTEPAGFGGVMRPKGVVGAYREGMGSQTELSKPENKYITKAQMAEGNYVSKERVSFVSSPANQYSVNVAYPTSARQVNF